MFDFKFDWRPEMETKIEKIDAQHKQIFRIGRDMEQLLVTRCIGVQDKQLLDIICDLREYVSYHFYEEAKLMEQANYSNLNEHIRQHNEFQSYVQQINLPKLKQEPYNELKKIKEHVTDWIYQHMLMEDIAMANEIRNK